MNPITATPAVLQAIIEAHQNIDVLLADEYPIDRATRCTVVHLLHRIEDATSMRNVRIDLSAPLASTDINQAWCHHAALELLYPLIDRLKTLGFELSFEARQ